MRLDDRMETLYDKKYVYFDWDDKLEGKKGFVAQDIVSLRSQVNDNPEAMVTLSRSNGDVCPFTYFCDGEITYDYQFAYYDPHYEIKRAYDAGMTIQYKYEGMTWNNWVRDDMPPDDYFEEWEWRIKPEETKWYIVLDKYGLSRTNSKEGERCVLFEGTEDECIKWMDEHKKFEKIMIAWINGAQIELEIQDPIRGIRWTPATKPTWDISNNYRVKPELEYIPFNSVQELIDAWEKKCPGNINRPDVTMPLIWIKNKEKNRVYLITDFLFEKCYGCDVGTEEEDLELSNLFKDYTFLDGSIIGKKKE